MKSAISTACLTAIIIGAGSLSGAALAAAASDDVPKRIVHYGDLDLARNAGAAVLYGRIKAAAREVCEPNDDPALWTAVDSRHCIEGAIARAVTDVNAPVLLSLYAAKAGKSAKTRQPGALARED